MNKYTCSPKVHKNFDADYCVSEDWITLVADITLKPHIFVRNCDLNIIIADDNLLKSLNLNHKGINDSTDVLSFNMGPIDDFVVIDDISSNSSSKSDFIIPDGAPGILGEVIISIEKVASQSEEKGISFDQELAILVIHGILHILGFDHEDDQDYQKMQKFADKAYSAVINIS